MGIEEPDPIVYVDVPRPSGRRLQYGYTQSTAPRRSTRRRQKHRILKLMTQEQVDREFPVEKFKTAREKSPLSQLNPAVELVEDDKDLEEAHQLEQEMKKEKEAKQAETPKRLSLNLMRPFASRHNSTQSVPAHKPDSSTVFEVSGDLEAQPVDAPKRSLDQASVSSMEATTIPTDAPTDVCAICISALHDEDEVRLLTCGHIFHSECIDPWLLMRQACCPMCKESYYKPKPEDPLGPDPVDVIESQYQRARQENQENGGGSSGQQNLGGVLGRWFGRSGSVAETTTSTGSTAVGEAGDAATEHVEMTNLDSAAAAQQVTPVPPAATGRRRSSTARPVHSMTLPFNASPQILGA